MTATDRPAFPCRGSSDGMPLRAWMMGRVLDGLLPNGLFFSATSMMARDPQAVAVCAIGIVDAALDQLDKPRKAATMTETELDYFEIAKKLTREHSRAAGDIYLKNTELGIAREIVALLVVALKRTSDRLEFVSEVTAKRFSRRSGEVVAMAREVLQKIGAQP